MLPTNLQESILGNREVEPDVNRKVSRPSVKYNSNAGVKLPEGVLARILSFAEREVLETLMDVCQAFEYEAVKLHWEVLHLYSEVSAAWKRLLGGSEGTGQGGKTDRKGGCRPTGTPSGTRSRMGRKCKTGLRSSGWGSFRREGTRRTRSDGIAGS